MKNKLFTLGAALMLAAVIGGFYTAPAIAAVIKAALVENVDERGRNPYTVELGCTGIPASGFSSCTVASAVIPAGKRLVLEHISGTVDIAAGAKLIDVVIFSASTTPNVRARLAPKFFGTNASLDQYRINEPIQIFIDGGDSEKLAVNASGTTLLTSMILTGYLVDLGI